MNKTFSIFYYCLLMLAYYYYKSLKYNIAPDQLKSHCFVGHTIWITDAYILCDRASDNIAMFTNVSWVTPEIMLYTK